MLIFPPSSYVGRVRTLLKNNNKSSVIPGFYNFSEEERLETLADFAGLERSQLETLSNYGNLDKHLAHLFIENTVGVFSLPLGVAPNFVINGKPYLVPMAVEESSVVAAASHGAKLVAARGGFKARVNKNPQMTGQMQFFPDLSCDFERILSDHKE